MFATALIVFREVFEAALIVSIVLAAAQGVRYRNYWIGAGIGIGVLGSLLVAASAEVIANALEGVGQELFNAGVLLAAVLMLGWHNVWMARHGRELASQMGAVGNAVRVGSRPLYALMLAVSLAVLREGSELVLFLYGVSAAGNSAGMFTGALIGLAGGVAVGALLYIGLLRVPTRHLFSVTSFMILLLAAGLAAQAAAFLSQAGLLPELISTVWDSSALLSEHSPLGEALHALIGYDEAPSAIQLLFYFCTLIGMLVLMKLFGKVPAAAKPANNALQ
ncbi:iron permease [Permianibacter sp. IMCC34836]|uniref:FTR1 family iron permease n=1 Tax=Permianibacter fluminis TaxID=2738515 RepID=UPI001555CD01|nr:FTR1 family protein [Permianibacter fluminis]NQD35881.1 iron permease [Permianibacter fluminis]